MDSMHQSKAFYSTCTETYWRSKVVGLQWPFTLGPLEHWKVHLDGDVCGLGEGQHHGEQDLQKWIHIRSSSYDQPYYGSAKGYCCVVITGFLAWFVGAHLNAG